MGEIEPYNGLLLEEGDEFAPIEWFNGNGPPPYRVTRIKGDYFYYTHKDFPNNAELTKNRITAFYGNYFMRLNNRYMEYDPTQQGDTDEDI